MKRVEAIRSHPKVGRGSCTSIDECMDDKDIIKYLDQQAPPITTEAGAIEWAMDMEGLHLERGLNQRWGEDNDPQLIAWNEWNK
jgi:hypothetical protein